MKHTILMFGVDAFALALMGYGSLAGRDYDARCKSVGFSDSAAHAWEGGK